MWPQYVSNPCTFHLMWDITLRKVLPGIKGQKSDETSKTWLLISDAFRERSQSKGENVKINKQKPPLKWSLEAERGSSHILWWRQSPTGKKKKSLSSFCPARTQPMRDCHNSANTKTLYFKLSILPLDSVYKIITNFSSI